MGIKKIISIFLLFLAQEKNSFSQCLSSEQAYKDYFLNNIQTLDPIEGIWSVNMTFRKLYDGEPSGTPFEYPNYDKIAIIKVGETFLDCDIPNASVKSIVTFTKTAVSGLYLYNRTDSDPFQTYKSNAILTSNSVLEYSREGTKYDVKEWWTKTVKDAHLNYPEDEIQNEIKEQITHLRIFFDFDFIKLYPTGAEISKSQPASGTGFALSSNGFIVTNHHVVDGANKITVKGVNGDFAKQYSAKVISEDKNNDIAILKIDDPTFTSFGTIPFTIKKVQDEVGTSIFVLGYPLRATMGDEIKLTNGIISSKSGFQGDITSYQVSAPVQPGNSGGPLFDDKGNLIGIVNAKHLDAENVSYAIKILYLNSLIESGNASIQLPTVNSLLGKSLSDQVKLIKKFVYIIEVN